MEISRGPRRRNADEAMLPLINVVFLLMVFFMIVGGMSVPDAIDLKPAQSQQLDDVDDDPLRLLVDREGRLALGRDVFEADQLASRIDPWRKAHPHESLQLQADAQADAQYVVALLEQLRGLGIEQVVLLTTKTGE